MGYRSEVSLVLTRDAFAHLCKTIPDYINQLVEDCNTFASKNDDFLLHYTHVKWYDTYPHISALMNTLRHMEEEHYHFLRLGDSNEDVEEKGYYFNNSFDTCVRREINVDLFNSKDVNLSAFI